MKRWLKIGIGIISLIAALCIVVPPLGNKLPAAHLAYAGQSQPYESSDLFKQLNVDPVVCPGSAVFPTNRGWPIAYFYVQQSPTTDCPQANANIVNNNYNKVADGLLFILLLFITYIAFRPSKNSIKS